MTGPAAALEPAELQALVERLAAEPDRWRSHVRHTPGRRDYAEILRDERVSAWVICWSESADTGFHDHGASAGAVAVIAGRVREERLRVAGPPASATFGPGGAFAFGPGDIHRVRHAGGEPAVTIHAYSPPLDGMGAYLVEPDGRLQRFALPVTEELRPLAAPASA